MGVGGQRHASAALHPSKNPDTPYTEGWVDPTAGLDECEEKVSCPNAFRTPDRPAIPIRLSWPRRA
jgi:hypothetical protein